MFPANYWTTCPDVASTPPSPSRSNPQWPSAPYPQFSPAYSSGQIEYIAAGAPESPPAMQPVYAQYPGIGVPGEPGAGSIFLAGDTLLDAHGTNLRRADRPSPAYGYNNQYDIPSAMGSQHPPFYSHGSPASAALPGISSGRSSLTAGDTMGSHAETACSLPWQAPGRITAPTAVSSHDVPREQKVMIPVARYNELVQDRPVIDERDHDKHVCPVCTTGVARGTLRRHLQTHVPKDSWPTEWTKSKTCPRCRRTLSRSDGLRRHLDSNICGDSCSPLT